MSPQPEVSRPSPELAENVPQLARGLVAAARNWTLYPQDHPAVRASFERLSRAIQVAANAAVEHHLRQDLSGYPETVGNRALNPPRPQMKIVVDRNGDRIEEPFLANTWERDSRGGYPRALVEQIDPELLGLAPLALL